MKYFVWAIILFLGLGTMQAQPVIKRAQPNERVTLSYRVQIKATQAALTDEEIYALTYPLRDFTKFEIKIVEEMNMNSPFPYKYLIETKFGTRASAEKFLAEIKELGMDGYLVVYTLTDKRAS